MVWPAAEDSALEEIELGLQLGKVLLDLASEQFCWSGAPCCLYDASDNIAARRQCPVALESVTTTAQLLKLSGPFH